MNSIIVTLVVIGCLAGNIYGIPVESAKPETQEQEQQNNSGFQVAVPIPAVIEHENQENPEHAYQVAVPLPALIQDETNPQVAVVPVTLLDVEPATEQSAASDDDSVVRSARGLGFGKFGGLNFGFKGGFGGLGGLGLHGLGLHGLGLHGFKPFFGKWFG